MLNSNYNSSLILELQNYLTNVRNLYPSLPKLNHTGIYDKETINTVAHFQILKGLPPTGNLDYNTWNTLVKENIDYLLKNQMSIKIPFSSHDFKDIGIHHQGDIVYAIKVMLNSLRRRYTNYKQLELTNLFDEETEETIKLFQERSMLPVTGIVDRITWNTLVTIYEHCRFYR